MHDRSPQNAKNRHRNQKLDPATATPSTRFNPRSFVAALGGLALLGALAACATGPTAAHETSISIAATTAPSATPTTVATPASVAAPTTVATPATVRPPTTTAHSSAVVDEFPTVDGARMHIRCVGSGATTVVLIGGFNDGGDNWGAIEAPLARDARVCSSARLGTGTSDPPTAVQTFTTQATQLRAALESVGEPGPYVLAGHSFGGAEAVAFASMFPDHVSGLVLIDATPDHLARGRVRRPRRRLRRRPHLPRQLHHLLPPRRQPRTPRRSRRLR